MLSLAIPNGLLLRCNNMRKLKEIPEQVWKDLQYEIAKNDLEYADNYRAYRYKDKLFYDEYCYWDDRGCCGVFRSHTIVDGDKWIIACNYGH